MNKTALITGGSRGIGRAIVLKLAEAGYNVIINYRSNSQQAESLVKEINDKFKVKVLLVQADISKNEEIEKLVKESLNHFQKIDVLVNNAGITRDNLLIRMKEEEWEEVLNTNFFSICYLTDLVVKEMQKTGQGKIINISSTSGVHGNAGQSNYSTAKSALLSYTKIKAKELMPQIQINCIAPGFVETDMTAGFDLAKMKETKVGRAARPEDIANCALWLVQGGDYVTGQIVEVDGGLTLFSNMHELVG